MNFTELKHEVYNDLPPQLKKKLRHKDLAKILRLVFEHITETLLLGDFVKINRFGKITPDIKKGGEIRWDTITKRYLARKPNIRWSFLPSAATRRRLGAIRTQMRQEAQGNK